MGWANCDNMNQPIATTIDTLLAREDTKKIHIFQAISNLGSVCFW